MYFGQGRDILSEKPTGCHDWVFVRAFHSNRDSGLSSDRCRPLPEESNSGSGIDLWEWVLIQGIGGLVFDASSEDQQNRQENRRADSEEHPGGNPVAPQSGRNESEKEGYGAGGESVRELGFHMIDVIGGAGHRTEDGRVRDGAAVVSEDASSQNRSHGSQDDGVRPLSSDESQRHQDRKEDRHRGPGTSGRKSDDRGDDKGQSGKAGGGQALPEDVRDPLRGGKVVADGSDGPGQNEDQGGKEEGLHSGYPGLNQFTDRQNTLNPD